MLLLVLGIIALACTNAMRVPLTLEAQIYKDGRSIPLMTAANSCGNLSDCWAAADIDQGSRSFWIAHSAGCPSIEPISRRVSH